LVVRYGITPVREARNALAKFSGYTKSISGVVLNDIPLSKLGYYSYSGYYSDERLST
jgi:hypothetical protein